MVVFDATFLILLLRPTARVPSGPDGKPVSHAGERIDSLVTTLTKTGSRIAVPTPALSEMLIQVTPAAASQIVEQMNRSSNFTIESFDYRAAIEVAAMAREVVRGESKTEPVATRAKLKFDRQIVSIAKVLRATVIYSDDKDVGNLGERHGIKVIRIHELELPESTAQTVLALGHTAPRRLPGASGKLLPKLGR